MKWKAEEYGDGVVAVMDIFTHIGSGTVDGKRVRISYCKEGIKVYVDEMRKAFILSWEEILNDLKKEWRVEK